MAWVTYTMYMQVWMHSAWASPVLVGSQILMHKFAWVLGHDMPLPDQWDGLGLNDQDIHIAVC